MSSAHLEHVNVVEGAVGLVPGDPQYPPQPAPTQVPLAQEVPDFFDSSGPIFSMYLKMAGEEDEKMAEDWKAVADGILIFTGLFSAAVASLISVSIQDIRPNSQDTSNIHLANIYQVLADPNRPNISIPSSPPTFSPPTYAVWVNSLWFMSLVISLTCALLATFLQQWARRYLKVTQPRYSPHRRARIRAFFFEGVERYFLPRVVDALPTLLHISLFLFFAGLVVFLFNVNLTIFKLVLSWVGACTAIYGCVTIMPLFHHDSPYYTPLTLLVWPTIIGSLCVIFRVLRYFIWSVYVYGSKDKFQKMLSQGMQKTAEGTALDFPPQIDTRAFMWTFDILDEDHELESFFSGLPGFRISKVAADPLPGLTREEKGRLCQAVIGLFDRTFSSNLLSESVKVRRASICAKVLDPAIFPVDCRQLICRVLFDDQCRGLRTAEFGHAVRGWTNNRDQGTGLVAQAICTSIVARAQAHDDSWFSLASNELGVPEPVLRDHASNGDSLSLAILIHVTRQQLSHHSKLWWPEYEFSTVLEEASRFNIHDTSAELQHEFCALWDRIVLQAQIDNANKVDDDLTIAWYILRPIRTVYIALHQNTTPTRFSVPTPTSDRYTFRWKSSSYTSCDIPRHRLDSTPHVRDVSASTAISHAALALGSLPSSPDAPSPSVPSSLRIEENPASYVPHLSSQPVYQTITESIYIPATSPDPSAAGATRNKDASAGTMPPTTPEASTLLSSGPSTGAIPPQHHDADLPTSSNAPDLPPQASPNTVLDNTPPTDHAEQTLVPDMGATEENEGTPNTAMRPQYKDALGPPSMKRAIHPNTNSTDLPLQSPSRAPVTGGVIASPSPRLPVTEKTEDRTYGVHSRYGIV